MFNHLEIYFLELIRGKRHGKFSSLLKGVLYLCSWIYRLVVAGRNWIFDHGWVCRYTPPVPVVISIGNIVAGGTGKTPVTLKLAQAFYDEFPIAILSRGYRSKAERLSSPTVLSRGQGPMHPASYCGDEPYMLALNLPKSFIFVGKDRYKASNMAAKAGAQLILLDDGMQHRRLARDFEVVVLDVLDPFGQGYFLPRGLLRESLKSLSRADLIILNHAHQLERFQQAREDIVRYTTAPIVATRVSIACMTDLDGNKVDSLQELPVGLFCGIAHPDYFQHTIQQAGAQIVDTYIIADHMEFDPQHLARFAKQCAEKGAKMLVCTEKDRVKLTEWLHLALPVVWIQMSLEFVEGKEVWEAFVERAKRDLVRRL